jgi:hypothetical protein
MIKFCISQKEDKEDELICQATYLDFLEIRNVRSCVVTALSDNLHENTRISLFTNCYWGQHSGKFNCQIYDCNSYGHGFMVDSKYLPYMPLGLERCFSAAIAFTAKNSKLRKISLNDLKHYSKLEYLDLSGNEIDILPSFLFQNNLNLKYLYLNRNRIIVIESNGLYGLRNLKVFEFWDNPCYSVGSSNQNEIRNFIQNTIDSCSISRLYININNKVETFRDELLNQKSLIDQTRNLTETIKVKIDHLTLLTQDGLHNHSQISSRFAENENATNPEDDVREDIKNLKNQLTEYQNQRIRFKYIIYALIIFLLLTYSCNFLIMYCLYPNDDVINNDERNDS